jgi:hypothetical protein
MTEAESRDLLYAWDGDGLELWIAAQPWRPTPTGWEVLADLQGWRFVIEQAPPRLRLRSSPPEATALQNGLSGWPKLLPPLACNPGEAAASPWRAGVPGSRCGL